MWHQQPIDSTGRHRRSAPRFNTPRHGHVYFDHPWHGVYFDPPMARWLLRPASNTPSIGLLGQMFAVGR
jgi:hypothetical protein